MLPAWAQEPEEYYNSLLERYKSLGAQRDQCQRELEALNLKLKATLARREYDHVMELKRALMPRYTTLEQEIGEYRLMVREASLKSWATTFFRCAEFKLERSQFLDLCAETEDMLGRHQTEVPAGRAEQTPHKRLAEARKNRRKGFRQTLVARRHGEQERVVYRDDE